jgi:hypothetical protein
MDNESAPSMETEPTPALTKVYYSLLRMFYVNNLNDSFIETVMGIVDGHPIDAAKAWVEALIAEITALPTLGPAQDQKTAYVVGTLQVKIQALEARITQGLPPF